MKRVPSLLIIALTALGGLGSCQRIKPTASVPATTPQPTGATTAAGTQAAARTALTQFLQQKPNAAVFQIDSAQFVDVDNHWQVMVPRTDWAGRMPNAAAFAVDKKTGQVTTLFVK
ncbi:hypothetical protein [Hymenobacter terricola]|uniref:hypothetical protein n=1 Tax=Hymenobacter terricola TaxID=2819236 RepID=UPI001B30F3A4|nr:hypothetical protein [Hymenobacter terricola]